jgi:hypothetical protein
MPMTAPYYLGLQGTFVILGKEPDGDSVRFIPDTPDPWAPLHRAYRVKPSRDGSVQLRLEGVDATELHYGTARQRFGAEARDQLLSWLGFAYVAYRTSPDTMVDSAIPTTTRGAILTKAVDANGRPIAYVLPEAAAAPVANGSWVDVDETLLSSTLNWCLSY